MVRGIAAEGEPGVVFALEIDKQLGKLGGRDAMALDREAAGPLGMGGDPHSSHSAPGVNIRREGVNGLRLMSDARNVAFSLGSACGSGSGKVSHVLRAMGVSEADARASIRLGWGRYTSEAELRDGLNAIKHAARLQGVN